MKLRNLLAIAAFASVSVGCSGDSSEQIWAFYLGVQVVDTDTQSLTHNFDDAYEQDSSSDWSTEGDVTESESIEFVEIVGLGNGETLLILQARTYLGATDGDKTTYSWDRFSEGNSYESHEQGYAYTHDWNDHVINTIVLTETEADGTVEGTWEITVTTDDTYNEDDEWDTTETGQNFSQVPAGTYLVVEDQFDNEIAATNDPNETDCTGDPCSLSVETTLIQTRTVTAVLTEYTADDLDRDVAGAGQPAGQ
jgi:hypothetical protein